MAKDLDPMEAIDLDEYEDPNPKHITDAEDPDYIAPAKGINPAGGK